MKIGALAKGRLAAGITGRDRIIEYVLTMDVPDVLGWLRGNELLLSSGYAIEGKCCLDDLIRGLASAGVAGIVLKEGRYLTASLSSLRVADEVGLPVILLPKDVSYHDVVNPLMKVIVGDRTGRGQRWGRDAEIVLNSLTRLISMASGGSAFLLDGQFRPISSLTNSGQPTVTREMFGPSGTIRSFVTGQGEQGSFLEACVRKGNATFPVRVWPLGPRRETVGYLVLVGGDRGLDPHHIQDILGALERLVESVDSRANEMPYLLDMLGGTPDDRMWALDELTKILGPLAGQPYVCYAARWEGDETNEHSTRAMVLSVFGAYSTTVLRTRPEALWLWHPSREFGTQKSSRQAIHSWLGHVINAQKMAEVFAAQIEALGFSRSRIGISSLHPSVSEVELAIKEAHRCLELCSRLERRVIVADNAMLDQLLYECGRVLPNDRDGVGVLAERLLETYLPQTIRRSPELVETLDAYFRTGRSVRETAGLLGAHRNTVSKRLERYQRITGKSLGDPETCSALEIALRLLRFRSG